jgi:periplasmic copper chaperone A
LNIASFATVAQKSGINMLVRTFVLLTSLLVGAMQCTPARAQEVKLGDLVISQAWSRATPGGAKVASGYLTIENKGSAPDRLLGGSTDAAGKVGMHEMATVNGVMTMRSLDGGLALPPGTAVKLAPSGQHFMLTDLKRPLKQGESVSITLKFEKAGTIVVPFNVLGVGAPGPDAGMKPAEGMDHGKMKM